MDYFVAGGLFFLWNEGLAFGSLWAGREAVVQYCFRRKSSSQDTSPKQESRATSLLGLFVFRIPRCSIQHRSFALR